MRERRDGAGLALESGDGLVIVRVILRQDLHRDVAAEARIAGAVHLSHAALAEQRDHFVGTDGRTRGEHAAQLYGGSRLEVRGKNSEVFSLTSSLALEPRTSVSFC